MMFIIGLSVKRICTLSLDGIKYLLRTVPHSLDEEIPDISAIHLLVSTHLSYLENLIDVNPKSRPLHDEVEMALSANNNTGQIDTGYRCMLFVK
jgi:hypothetical protein